ncbi:MAG: hypothetical protein GEU83_15890 [Pseudonocardiaceae bacterium]|nr:hypothetical protein [Pseudonocardiaceae bacterium]
MKVRSVLAAAALTLVAGFVPQASAASPAVTGDFSLMAMVHTTQYQDSDLATQDPNPWNGSAAGGPYRYASIPCSGSAPVNNISTNLTTYNSQLPASRSPASTRNHPLEFVVQGSTLHGRIVLTTCQREPGATESPDPVPDGNKDKVLLDWNATYERTSPEEVAWSGRFTITGGTGVYEDLTGRGTMSGYFFCFADEGCESLGEFRDAQYTMTGTYRDPTP